MSTKAEQIAQLKQLQDHLETLERMNDDFNSIIVEKKTLTEAVPYFDEKKGTQLKRFDDRNFAEFSKDFRARPKVEDYVARAKRKSPLEKIISIGGVLACLAFIIWLGIAIVFPQEYRDAGNTVGLGMMLLTIFGTLIWSVLPCAGIILVRNALINANKRRVEDNYRYQIAMLKEQHKKDEEQYEQEYNQLKAEYCKVFLEQRKKEHQADYEAIELRILGQSCHKLEVATMISKWRTRIEEFDCLKDKYKWDLRAVSGILSVLESNKDCKSIKDAINQWEFDCIRNGYEIRKNVRDSLLNEELDEYARDYASLVEETKIYNQNAKEFREVAERHKTFNDAATGKS